jgi:hypothetical protein
MAKKAKPPLEEVARRIISTLHLPPGDKRQYLLSDAICEYDLSVTESRELIHLISSIDLPEEQ